MKIGILLGDDIGLEMGQMLMAWLGRKRKEPKAVAAAERMHVAIDKIVSEGKHLTKDLGGKASTSEMGDAIAAAV